MCKVWTKSLESSSKYFVYECQGGNTFDKKELRLSFFVILVLFTFKESREKILMNHGFF